MSAENRCHTGYLQCHNRGNYGPSPRRILWQQQKKCHSWLLCFIDSLPQISLRYWNLFCTVEINKIAPANSENVAWWWPQRSRHEFTRTIQCPDGYAAVYSKTQMSRHTFSGKIVILKGYQKIDMFILVSAQEKLHPEMELCCSQSTDGGPVILPAPVADKMNKSSNAQNGFNDLLGLQYKAP